MPRPLGSKNKPKLDHRHGGQGFQAEISGSPKEINRLSETQKRRYVCGVSIRDLCYILDTASKLNVSTLRLGEITVSFHPKGETAAPRIGEDRVARMVDSLAHEELERTQLILDDPRAFEQQQIDMLTSKMGMNEKAHNS